MKLFQGPRRKLSITLASVAATLVVGGGAAFAAMLVTGQGQAHASAYIAQTLTVSGEGFDKEVWPGVQASLVFTVSNPNPFPVTITKIGYDASRADKVVLACNGATAAEKAANVSKLSGPAGAVGFSYNLLPSEQIDVASNSVGTVHIANALHLDASATAGCNVTVPFTVTGAGSGN